MIRRIVATSVVAILTTVTQHADAQTVATPNRALQMASDTGGIAGGGAYCQVDPEMVEQYITRALARVAALTDDQLDLVAARIEFNNTYAAASARAPAGGCNELTRRFPGLLRQLDE